MTANYQYISPDNPLNGVLTIRLILMRSVFEQILVEDDDTSLLN